MANFGDKGNFDFESRNFSSETGAMAPRPIAEQARANSPMTSWLASLKERHESRPIQAAESPNTPSHPVLLQEPTTPEAAPALPPEDNAASSAPANPPADADALARKQEARSHQDLRQHIQAQLEFLRNSRSDASRLGQKQQPSVPAAPPATPARDNDDDSAENADDQDSPLQDEQPIGATVIDVRPPAFHTPVPADSMAQNHKQDEEQPTAPGQESELERVSGNLAQLAAQGGILRRIIEEKLTGQLLLMSEGEQENQQELVYIQEGVMLGCSSLMHTPIRNLLLSAGLVRLEDIEEAKRQTAASGGEGSAVESWLVRKGIVTREQVFETLGVAAREAVVSMMCREFGIFVWKGQPHPNAPKTLCKIPMREVALHYGRSLAPFEALQPTLFNPGRIFKIHESFNIMHSQYRLLPHEWKFLFRVDGKRTLRQIREAIDIPVDSLNRHVFVCDLMGFISDCGLAQGEAKQESAVPAPRTTALPTAAVPGIKAPQSQAIDDRPKILIVDDSRTVQKMVLMALEQSNYHLRTADDGFEALQLIENTPPDLVLLDVIMPRMDGYKVCSRIRKLLAPVKIPIIMLTARDGTYNNIRAKLAGATTVMNKPFDPEELRQTIGKYLAVR